MPRRHGRGRASQPQDVASTPSEPYVELARELQASIDARITAAEADLEGSFTDVLRSMEEAALRTHVMSMVDLLPTDERVALYARALNDERLLALVAESAQLDRDLLERQARMQRLRRDVLVSRMLDLTELGEGEVLEIGMFDGTASSPSYAMRGAQRRTLTVRLRDSSAGECLKIRETVSKPAFAEPPELLLEDIDVVRLGTAVEGDGGLEFAPSLTYGRQVQAVHGMDTVIRFPETLGYVLVGSDVILDRPTI